MGAAQSLAIKKKREMVQHSIFGAKHDEIIDLLIHASNQKLSIIQSDQNILKLVEKAFYFDVNAKQYIKINSNEQRFDTLMDCIQFMLKQEWDYDYTKNIYLGLVKYLSLTQKAKLFSVGVDRKDRKISFFKQHKDCFVGNEAVDWLVDAQFVKNTDDKRERATDLANSFYTKGFIKDAVATKVDKFKDENLCYCFNDELIETQCLLQWAYLINK